MENVVKISTVIIYLIG